jgi:hypothetical protein
MGGMMTMNEIALITVGEKCKKDAKKVFSHEYFFNSTITEKELRQEIEDLKDFYDEVIVGDLPPHIRYYKLFPGEPTGTAKED